MRERGLKLATLDSHTSLVWSLPMRERGLKQVIAQFEYEPLPVAPHAGAWIETCLMSWEIRYYWSLPMRERGLKPTGLVC